MNKRNVYSNNNGNVTVNNHGNEQPMEGNGTPATQQRNNEQQSNQQQRTTTINVINEQRTKTRRT